MAAAKEHIGPEPEERWLLGEWKLLSALPVMREPNKMIRLFDEAIGDMGGRRSQVADGNTAFGFSDDSLFWMLLRDPGQANRAGALLAKAAERYFILTGCGQGFAEFFQSELAYQRGDLFQARLLAYQANYIARSTNQTRLIINSAKQIGHVAIHQCDMNDWTFAINTIAGQLEQSRCDSHEQLSLRSVAALTYAEVLISLGNADAAPAWIKEGRFNVSGGVGICNLKYAIQNDPNITAYEYPLALWTHALYLLSTGQYARALAVDAVQRMFGIEKEFLVYQIYYSLLRGVCYLGMGDRARASAEFASAVELIVPDGLWLTVAEFVPISDGLILEAVRNCGGDTATVRLLASGFNHNASKLREAVAGQDVDRLLTAREKEIALLVAQGLRNREIAEQLNITEQTVKFHLSNTYSKLEIDNRAKLVATLKNLAQKLY